MSYILEAIKKADQKRKLGSVPDVHSEHSSAFSVNKRAKWPYWAALVLFVNAGLIGWWLSSSDNGGDLVEIAQVSNVDEVTDKVLQDATPKPPPQIDPSEDKKPLPANVENAATTSPLAEEITGEVDGGSTSKTPVSAALDQNELLPVSPAGKDQSVAGLNKDQSQVVDMTIKSAEPSAPKVSSFKSSSSGTVGVAKGVVAQKQPDVGAGALASKESSEDMADDPSSKLVLGGKASENEENAAAVEALDSTEQEPIIVGRLLGSESMVLAAEEDDLVEEYKLEKEKETEEKKLERIPFYYQLPDSVQQTLPEIHISFHVYSRKPSARIVSVNKKVLREGQYLDKKIKLEQITPLGIVLLSGTRRFKVEID